MESDAITYGVTDQDYDTILGESVDFEQSRLLSTERETNTDNKFRRLLWLRWLGVISGDDPHEWVRRLQKIRMEYSQLASKHRSIDTELTKYDPQIAHPLSNADDNPWKQMRDCEELENEIIKDVHRTFPEYPYFQRSSTQDMLLRQLYTWSKENPNISYKQGMNEVMGIFVIVCYRDQYIGTSQNTVCSKLCSADAIEADAYLLFSQLMNLGMKDMFQAPSGSNSGLKLMQNPIDAISSNALLFGGGLSPVTVSPILDIARYIYDKILRAIDPSLYHHLSSLDVEPQIFLLRWIRLLFSREFHLDNALRIWDSIFSDCFSKRKSTPNHIPNEKFEELNLDFCKHFSLTAYIAVAMILFVKTNIMESDFSGCMHRLLKFPPVGCVESLLSLSLELRNKFNGRYDVVDNVGVSGKAASSGERLSATPQKTVLANSMDHPLGVSTAAKSELSSLQRRFDNLSKRLPKSPFFKTSPSVLPSNAHGTSHEGNEAGLAEAGHQTTTSEPPIFIELQNGPILSGGIIGSHISQLENFLHGTIYSENGVTVRNELELVLHDLKILKRIMLGDLQYDPRLFMVQSSVE